jgi:hypothetical protein
MSSEINVLQLNGAFTPHCDYLRSECFCARTKYELLLRRLCPAPQMDFEEYNLHRRDTLHLVLCIVSVIVGFAYRRVEGVERRKWTGSVIGLIVVYAVMGVHFWHVIVATLIAAGIIRMSGWK